MSHLYCRPLNKTSLVENFFKNCLQINSPSLTNKNLILDVLKEELIISNIPVEDSTLNREDYRHPNYRDEENRKALRERIFIELYTKTRLENDNNVRLGYGGAKPKNKVKKDASAFFIIGLPASGKSTISAKIADEYGAYIIDSDYAKLKLPEYKTLGANSVHKESSAIVRGSSKTKDEKNLFELCIRNKANMVIPTIGQDQGDLEEERDFLLNEGYTVHLILISLPREEATRRALERFRKTKRYVPLSLIFDGYANEPVLTYYRTIRTQGWATYGKLNTSSSTPKVIDRSENDVGSPMWLFDDTDQTSEI